MATLPPGSRTPFVLPDRARPRALGRAASSFSELPYTPLPMGGASPEPPPPPPPPPSEPRYYTVSEAAGDGVTTALVFISDNPLNYSLGGMAIAQCSLLPDTTFVTVNMWSFSPSDRETNRWMDLAVDEDFVYICGINTTHPSPEATGAQPYVARKSVSAPADFEESATVIDASWSDYGTPDEFVSVAPATLTLLASGSLDPTSFNFSDFAATQAVLKIDRATGALWLYVTYQYNTDIGTIPDQETIAMLFTRPAVGGAWSYVSQVAWQMTMAMAYPNNTVPVTLNPELTTLTLHTTPPPTEIAFPSFEGLSDSGMLGAGAFFAAPTPDTYILILRSVSGPGHSGPYSTMFSGGNWSDLTSIDHAYEVHAVLNDGQLWTMNGRSWDGVTFTQRIAQDPDTYESYLFDGTPIIRVQGQDPMNNLTGFVTFPDGSILELGDQIGV